MFHTEIIADIISAVATKERTEQILNFSKKHYDLHQFNISTLYPKDVRKMNQSLKRRYKKKEIQILPTNWNQGERRLFVWFIICFLSLKRIPIQKITQSDLESLSDVFYGKSTMFLDFQLRNLPKTEKSKRQWTNEEDELLRNAIESLKGESQDTRLFNNWNDVAKIIFFQTQRQIFKTPKACRQRWYNHVDDTKKKDQFSNEQDLLLINHILQQNKSWSKIVRLLNYTRTEHRIKNRYYTLIRKYQRNIGLNKSLSEAMERQILMKLKIAYQERKMNGEIKFEINQNAKVQKASIYMEDQLRNQIWIQEAEKCIQDRVSDNLKIQNNQQIIQYSNCAESDRKIYYEIKALQENQISEKSSNQNYADSEKQHSKRTLPHLEELSPYQSAKICVDQSSLNNFTYYPMNYMYNPIQTFYQQAENQPIIINQFYCPIYFQGPNPYQFY